MSVSFRRFVVVEALGVATMNAGINAFYTWWLWRERGPLPLQGAGGIAFDLASTPVWIAILSTLLGMAAIRAKLRDGRVRMPASRARAVLEVLPGSVLLRAAVLGAVAVIVLAVPLRWALGASGIEEMSLGTAVLTKVALTVPLSLLIVPVVVLTGVADLRRARILLAGA